MAIDLFGLILSSGVSWGVGKVLDVLLECNRCGERADTRIGNAQLNSLGCRNCSHSVNQFTNACGLTVGQNGRLGHVGLRLGYLEHTYDPKKFITSNKYGYLYFGSEVRAHRLSAKQFVISRRLLDYNSEKVYAESGGIIYTSQWDDTIWTPKSSSSLYFPTIPQSEQDDRILAVEILARSNMGDILCRERVLLRLWNHKGHFKPELPKIT
jgi:hypothetical protein